MDTDLDSNKTIDDLVEFGRTLIKWSWLLVLVAVIFGGAVYYYTNQLPRVYQASTKLVVNITSDASGVDVSAQALTLAGKYARTMITKDLLSRTATELGTPISKAVDVLVDEFFPILEIRVTDSDPGRAADTANMIVKVFSENESRNQASRYAELATNIEAEIAKIDVELTNINSKLAAIQANESPLAGTETVEDSATYVRRAQLELSLAQYTQTRYSLVYNLQQVRLSEIKSQITFTQLDPAVSNPVPVRPLPLRDAFYAALIGFVLCGVVVFVVDYLGDEINNPDEITRRYHLPILGLIPNYSLKDNELISKVSPRNPATESYRLLRTNLQYSSVDNPLKSILVTSSIPGEGKSSLVANLGQVMAQIHQNVVMIDCDLHRPKLHKFFQLANWLGLTDLLAAKTKKLGEVYFRTGTNNLYMIPSGPLPPNPSEILNSTGLKELVSFLTRNSDIVILDSPPLLAVADSLVLASHVDGVILVVNPKRSKRKMLEYSIEQLKQVNAKILGVVMNDVKVSNLHYGYKRKYYGKKYDSVYGQNTKGASPLNNEKSG